MKKLLLLLFSVPLAAQTINPNQIRPSNNSGWVLTTPLANVPPVWAPIPATPPALDMSVNPPISGQYAVIYPLTGTIDNNPGNFSNIAPTGGSGYFKAGCTGLLCGTAAPMQAHWQFGSLMAYGINPANVTAIYFDAISSGTWFLNDFSANNQLSCSITGTGTVQLLPWASAGHNYPYDSQEISGLTGATGAQWEANLPQCRIQIGPWSGGVGPESSTGTIIPVPAIRAIVYYTGTPQPTDNNLHIQPPLGYNQANNTLYVDDAGWTAYNIQTTTVENLPLAGTANLQIWGVYNSSDCATDIGLFHFALCVSHDGGWNLFTNGGSGGGDTITSPGSTLSVGGTPTNTTLDVDLAHANTWTAKQTQPAPLLSNITGSTQCLHVDSTGQVSGTGSDCGAGGGGVGGSGTAGFYALWSASTTLGNGSLDDGITNVGFITSSKPVKVVCSTCATQVDLAYNSGHAPAGSAGIASIAPDTTGNLTINPNNTGYTIVPPLASGFVSGHCGQPTSSGGVWTIADAGAACGSGSGGGYTNVVASSTSDTTVAIINGKCSTGQSYLLSTAATLTAGGTINCPVIHTPGGQWSAGSAVSVTLAGGLSELAPFIATKMVGTNVTIVFSGATQAHAPVEWWGAVADWTSGTSGTDNTTAIQACLTAHPVQCDILNGAYKITSALSITSSNLGIHGVAMQYNPTGSALIQTTASADIIDVAGASTSSLIFNNYLDHFTGIHSVVPTGTAKGLSIRYTSSAYVDHVLMQDNIYNFYITKLQNGVISDCVAQWLEGYSSGSLYGFYVDASVSITSGTFQRDGVNGGTAFGSGATTFGFYELGASMADVFADWFQSSTTDYGIYINGTGLGTDQFSAFDIHFKNSILDGIGTSCGYVTNMPASAQSAIEFLGGECSLQPTAASGVAKAFDIESSNGISVGMEFSQGSHAGNTGWLAAIYANSSTGLILNGNIITPVTGTSGIILNNTNNSTVSGNSITMNGAIGTPGVLINLTGTSSNNTITGNGLYGGGTGAAGIAFGASAAGNNASNNGFANVATVPVTDANGTNSWSSTSNAVINGALKNNNLAGSGSRCIHTDASGNITASSTDCGTVTSLTTTGTSGAATLTSGVLNIPNYGAAGGGALTQIAQSVAGGSSGVISFTTISGGFSTLQLQCFGRSSTSAAVTNVLVTFNSDTTSGHYHYQYAFWNNTTPTSANVTNGTNMLLANVPAATATTNAAGSFAFNIPGYAGTTFFKQITDTGNYFNSGSPNPEYFVGGGEWQSTAAVTRIDLTLAAGNWVSGSTCTLYGMQ